MATIICPSCGDVRPGKAKKGTTLRCWKCFCLQKTKPIEDQYQYREADRAGFAQARTPTMKMLISGDWTKPNLFT